MAAAAPLMDATPDNLSLVRNWALLLIRFAASPRRSELSSGLDVSDLTETAAGLRLRIRARKTTRNTKEPR
jgi:hypothetical protein